MAKETEENLKEHKIFYGQHNFSFPYKIFLKNLNKINNFLGNT